MFIPDKAKRKNDEKTKGRPAVLTPGQRMALILLLIISAGAIVWTMDSQSDSNSQFPTARLTYTSDGQRYALNLQTGDRSASYRVPDPAAIPHVSPDGNWVVFWRPIYETDNWELIVQETQKPETQRLLGTFIGPVSGLSWSADNDHIVFSSHFNFERPEFCHCDEEIYLISRTTGQKKRLTINANFDTDPVFSPDGKQIVYTSALDNYDRLYIMDVATGRGRVLTPHLYGYTPQWSPDGQWIAFKTTSYDTNGDIWIIRPDGTDAQAVTMGIAADEQPEWLR